MYYFVANLSLNKSCIFNDQCSGSPYASCLGDKCSCIEGYQAVNATDCVLSMMQIYILHYRFIGFLFQFLMMAHEIKTLYSVNVHKLFFF